MQFKILTCLLKDIREFKKVFPALICLCHEAMTKRHWGEFFDQIDQDVFDVLTLEGSVNARDHIGGTAPAQVRAAVTRGRKLLKD